MFCAVVCGEMCSVFPSDSGDSHAVYIAALATLFSSSSCDFSSIPSFRHASTDIITYTYSIRTILISAQYSCAERNDDYHEESGERGIHSVCRLNFDACGTPGITEKEIHSLRQEKDRSIRQWRPLHDADGRLAPADRRD